MSTAQDVQVRETRFQVHFNMATGQYAWFRGDRRESPWFTTKAETKAWNIGDCFTNQRIDSLLRQYAMPDTV
jgi:hypothetical protein